ncbi:MAG: hypothetical protein IT167_22675 [Bryobacterales bacterium]|nr:hypothetical protein [Bryobacterales bacterium]
MIRQSLAERTPSLKEVKQTLLAKGNEAVIMQKLSALQNYVVPATSVDDPLVDDPPTLVDFDFEGGTLILVLSRPVTPAWIKQFHAMNSYGSVVGKEPDPFNIAGNRASISARGHELQQIIDFFKEWLMTTNRDYAALVAANLRKADESERQRLKAATAQAEEELRLRRTIKI